jgi:hypothetical protein
MKHGDHCDAFGAREASVLKGRLMGSFLDRRIDSVDQRLVLVAPPFARIPSHFRNVTVDSRRHRRHVQELQRLRGGIYLSDGAVRREQLSPDGLHQTPEDFKSWHLLMFREQRQLSSCAWYLKHEDAQFDQLRVRSCPLRDDKEWRAPVSLAVESELARARTEGVAYAELGGWAISTESRCSSEGLLVALATYGLSRVLGGALGMTTATVRHCSSTILKRLGGSPLEFEGAPLPSYFDARYGCEMELLRFDSRRPSAKYERQVEMLEHKLANVAVIAPGSAIVEYDYEYAAADCGSVFADRWMSPA